MSVPCLDFFGLPHGRPVAYASALTHRAGRSRLQQLPADAVRPPHPHRARQRLAAAHDPLLPGRLHVAARACRPSSAVLHATFRRENPTVLRRDFVIADGLRGPGRFLGCNVGVRVIDHAAWYGEGEVKIYRDGDDDAADDLRHRPRGLRRQRLGHGRAQRALRRCAADRRARAPARTPTSSASTAGTCPTRSCSSADLRVTIQQIGAMFFAAGQEARAGRRTRRRTRSRARAGIRDLGAWAARVGHRRAGRRLLRDRVRLLPRAAAGAAPRPRRGARRHRAPRLRGAKPAREHRRHRGPFQRLASRYGRVATVMQAAGHWLRRRVTQRDRLCSCAICGTLWPSHVLNGSKGVAVGLGWAHGATLVGVEVSRLV